MKVDLVLCQQRRGVVVQLVTKEGRVYRLPVVAGAGVTAMLDGVRCLIQKGLVRGLVYSEGFVFCTGGAKGEIA